MDTPQSARRLREQLAEVRRNRKGERGRHQAPKAPEITRSKCGPGGQMREHPLMIGLHWLHRMGQALIISGVCFNSKLDIVGWERDGCIGLGLQQRVKRGNLADVGGHWEWRRIPVEIPNNQDTRALLGKLFEKPVADLLFASNELIRVSHHGN